MYLIDSNETIGLWKSMSGSKPRAWLNCLSTADCVRGLKREGPAPPLSAARRWRAAPWITSSSSAAAMAHSEVVTSLEQLHSWIVIVTSSLNDKMSIQLLIGAKYLGNILDYIIENMHTT